MISFSSKGIKVDQSFGLYYHYIKS